MISHVRIPQIVEKITSASQASDDFATKGRIVAYKTSTYTGILCKLTDKSFGFVVVGKKNVPHFVRSTPVDSIEAACRQPNEREVIVCDNLQELANYKNDGH